MFEIILLKIDFSKQILKLDFFLKKKIIALTGQSHFLIFFLTDKVRNAII